MSVPNPAATDWVPLATGPPGLQGPQGATGPKGDAGAAASVPVIGFRSYATWPGTHSGWTIVGFANYQLTGWSLPDPTRPVIPQEGWYFMSFSMYYTQAFSGGGQKQIRIELGGTDTVGSGSIMASAQMQESQALDDLVNCAGIYYFGAGSTLRCFAYSGQTENFDTGGGSPWSMVRVS